ncbi:hypothetical protein EYF80_006598 [Liparis tanakae]|uniref:Uncharacterized protein n=1 Tax=Liparis tanakae TaxID=230148 RepID=A0A4Z2IYX6_9TELE|nr:hypothetical protein EYF80_006598 [Liparis tanakae]
MWASAWVKLANGPQIGDQRPTRPRITFHWRQMLRRYAGDDIMSSAGRRRREAPCSWSESFGLGDGRDPQREMRPSERRSRARIQPGPAHLHRRPCGAVKLLQLIGPSCRLHGAQLHGAQLHGARLHGARLHGARLHGARLHGAQLEDALRL